MRGDERHTVRDSDSERGTNPLRLDRRQQVEGRADLLGEAALVPMGSSPKVFSHALADCQELVLQYSTFFLFKCLHSELLKSVNYFDLLNRVSLFSDQP